MKRQLTLAQYRSVDLTLFAVILAVCEYVITLAAIRWFPGQLYTVSLSAALCAIVLMRWGAWAGLHALFGGAAFWLASGGTPRQLAVYALGNLFCLYDPDARWTKASFGAESRAFCRSSWGVRNSSFFIRIILEAGKYCAICSGNIIPHNQNK